MKNVNFQAKVLQGWALFPASQTIFSLPGNGKGPLVSIPFHL